MARKPRRVGQRFNIICPRKRYDSTKALDLDLDLDFERHW